MAKLYIENINSNTKELEKRLSGSNIANVIDVTLETVSESLELELYSCSHIINDETRFLVFKDNIISPFNVTLNYSNVINILSGKIVKRGDNYQSMYPVSKGLDSYAVGSLDWDTKTFDGMIFMDDQIIFIEPARNYDVSQLLPDSYKNQMVTYM
ncbi:unnamed protein product [Gordionus sp. m RMFG-2023]